MQLELLLALCIDNISGSQCLYHVAVICNVIYIAK